MGGRPQVHTEKCQSRVSGRYSGKSQPVLTVTQDSKSKASATSTTQDGCRAKKEGTTSRSKDPRTGSDSSNVRLDAVPSASSQRHHKSESTTCSRPPLQPKAAKNAVKKQDVSSQSKLGKLSLVGRASDTPPVPTPVPTYIPPYARADWVHRPQEGRRGEDKTNKGKKGEGYVLSKARRFVPAASSDTRFDKKRVDGFERWGSQCEPILNKEMAMDDSDELMRSILQDICDITVENDLNPARYGLI